jgi:hypothetical protein
VDGHTHQEIIRCFLAAAADDDDDDDDGMDFLLASQQRFV